MTTTKTRYVILAAIDHSEAAELVCARAAELASSTPGSELHVVHSAEIANLNIGTLADEVIAGANVLFERAVKTARARFQGNVVTHFIDGGAEASIRQLAASLDADLIVVGTHGRVGLDHALFGSIAEGVVRKASCPVLVVREKTHQKPLTPEIEPPCVDCVAKQRETCGETLWCARHAAHHPRAHLHYAYPQGFAEGSMLVRS